MKRITFFVAFAIALSNFNANGQEKETVFGIKAGINYSNFILGKDIPSAFPAVFNGKIGFHFGAFLKIRLSDDLILKPELLFSLQGAEYEINIGSAILVINEVPLSVFHRKIDFTENLILIPIMLDYYFNKNVDIEFGPQLAYVISQDISGNNKNLKYDKFEIGLNVGLGYNFAKKYRVGVRYNYGIMERNNLKTSVLKIGLEYKLI